MAGYGNFKPICIYNSFGLLIFIHFGLYGWLGENTLC
jgi:hypothetical protein